MREHLISDSAIGAGLVCVIHDITAWLVSRPAELCNAAVLEREPMDRQHATEPNHSAGHRQSNYAHRYRNLEDQIQRQSSRQVDRGRDRNNGGSELD